jgi:hypothetical protein
MLLGILGYYQLLEMFIGGLTIKVSWHTEDMFIAQFGYSLEEILSHGDCFCHLGGQKVG